MKRILLVSIAFIIAINTYAERAEITVMQTGIVNKVNVYFDNGSGKPEIVKDNNGDKFTSPVAALKYFTNKGWILKEMHVSTAMATTIRIYVITKKEE